uniref:Zinc finger protein 470 n=1 Tax=Drosophila rhopaloa TaxID=1041015 RepID=A0A6P4FCW3_DRORH
MDVQCRLCGLYIRHKNPRIIFNRGVLAKVKAVTGLSLREEEHLPRHICPSCLKELNMTITLRKRIRQNHKKLMLRKMTNTDLEEASSSDLELSKNIEHILEANASDQETEAFYTKLDIDNIKTSSDFRDLKLFNMKKTESPDRFYKLKYESNGSDQKSENYMGTILKIDNLKWKPSHLNKPGSPDFDYLCKLKLRANESDQETEYNEWFNENNHYYQNIVHSEVGLKNANSKENEVSSFHLIPDTKVKFRKRIRRNQKDQMLRKRTASDPDLGTHLKNTNSNADSSCDLELSTILENISESNASDEELEKFYMKPKLDNTRDFKLFDINKLKSPDFDHLYKIKNQENDSDAKSEHYENKLERQEFDTILNVDNLTWKPSYLNNAESLDFDHLCKLKYRENESDQEPEVNEEWFNENNRLKYANCKRIEVSNCFLNLDLNRTALDFKSLKVPQKGSHSEVLLSAKKCNVSKYPYQNNKAFENDQEFEDYKQLPTRESPTSTRFPQNHKKPLIETSLLAKGNAIPNGQLRVSKGEFINIKTQLCLNKTEVVIKTVKPSEAAENIPPAKRIGTRKTQSLQCTKCGKLFKTNYNLKMHLLRHTGQRDFACNFCDRRFVSIHLQKLHQRVRHMGERPFKCSFCHDTFFTSTAKNRHEQMKHIRDRRYICDECGKQFRTKTCLNHHKILHTDMNAFYCDICNVNFSRKKNMKRHFQSQAHQKRATAILDNEQCLDLQEVQFA